jgi:ATP-dependent Clp protease protease subunit
MEGVYGHVSDLEIQSAEIQRMRRQMETMLARHTKRNAEQVRADIERNRILPAEQTVEYGLADEVMPYRKLSAPRR